MADTWDTPDPELVRIANSLQEGRVLDVGCGGGHDSIWLARNGWSVVAIDTSKHAVAKVCKLAEKDSLDITANRVDATTHTYSCEFDLVSICYMHLARAGLVQMLTRAVSALKNNGTLIVRCFESSIEEAPFDRSLLPSRASVVDTLSDLTLIQIADVADEFFPYMKKEMRLLTVVAKRSDGST